MNKGKGKAIEVPKVHWRRTREQVDRDEYQAYLDSFVKRGVKNERFIERDDGWPGNFQAFTALKRQGLTGWFNHNPGYNRILVAEFYRNMSLPPWGKENDSGAKIMSTVGGKPVMVNANKIASALGYLRPTAGINFPAQLPVERSTIEQTLYENVQDCREPHVPGKFRPEYRVLNQVVCHNLVPRASAAMPRKRTGIIIWALGDPNTVCDWAQFIFREMVEVRDASKKCKMSFPCLLTRIIQGEYRLGDRYYPMHRLSPGPIDSTFLTRSYSQNREVERPLLQPPPKDAGIKVWVERMFGVLSAVCENTQELKRELKVMARQQLQIQEDVRQIRQRVFGEASTSQEPLQPPPVEDGDEAAGDTSDGEDSVEEDY